MNEQRARILEALARGDGQMLDGFDLGHTAEMMYGKQADAVTLLIAQEIHRSTGAACGLGRCLFTYTVADEQDYSDLYVDDEDAS